MIKTARNILILSMMGICMIACSSDDTESETAYNKISAPTVNGKRLVKIKHGEEFTSLEYNPQGQVAKVKYHSKDGTTREESYWYEDRRVIWSPYELIYNLSNGHAVELNFTALTSLDEDAMTVEGHESYLYDTNGRLVKAIKAPYDFSEDGPINPIYTYTWRDGNISSVLVSVSSGDMEPNEEYNIRYTSVENNIPLFFVYYYSNNVYLEWQGCFGRRCKNLPQSVTYINLTMDPSWEWGVRSVTDTFNYTLEDGMVTKIAVESIDDKGNSGQDVYELEWW